MIQFSIKLKNGHSFTKTYNYDMTEEGIEAGYDRCYEEYPGAYVELI